MLQGYGKTLLHQKCSQSQKKASVGRCFTKFVLENLAKFTGKHLCWSHFLIKLHA